MALADSVIFFATIYRTITLYRRTVIGEAQSLITVIMRDGEYLPLGVQTPQLLWLLWQRCTEFCSNLLGVMYFTAIFASNLVTVLIFIVRSHCTPYVGVTCTDHTNSSLRCVRRLGMRTISGFYGWQLTP